jgi:hypothetical protein
MNIKCKLIISFINKSILFMKEVHLSITFVVFYPHEVSSTY